MRQLLGKDNVWFLTGTDEHGQKIQRAAQEANVTAQEFADQVSLKFKQLWAELGISYNDFIRTTEQRHKNTVQKVLEIVYAKGDIYQSAYEGFYCAPCESFWTQQQAVDRLCPDCKRPVEKISEQNYFFRLSKYQDWLIDYIEQHPNFIRPEIRRNEVKSFLKLNKLNDLCISRPKERLNWGIPLPFSSAHVTYVWFDALINYISAVGEFDEGRIYRSRWWPADVQLIGKDILRQHAIYWPIMLKALDIEPPKTICAHGWWLMQNAKMSKSLGNVVDPFEMAKKYGIDAYRYFLLRDVPFGLDGSFSEEAIVKRYNSDLANDLGNLVYRTLTMVEKYYNNVVPKVDLYSAELDEAGGVILKQLENVFERVDACLKAKADYNFGAGLEAVWSLINSANKYVEQTKPWNLSKENKVKELAVFIRLMVEVICKASFLIEPFIPRAASAISVQLGANTIKKGSPLFPRIEAEG
jgi:methionyl-tRNA synthetase